METDLEIRLLELDLNRTLTMTYFDEKGVLVETRELVERIDNLKLEIYPNEHPPPHFHVKSNEFNVLLSIEDCRIIKGDLKSQTFKKVLSFHRKNKAKLIEVWNRLRPSDCLVGPI